MTPQTQHSGSSCRNEREDVTQTNTREEVVRVKPDTPIISDRGREREMEKERERWRR